MISVAAALVLLLALALVLPRQLLRRAQDRLAGKRMEREGAALKLLTRADLVVGHYRRLPGVLALKEGSVEFEGLFGDTVLIPTARIEKILTGKRLSSGRSLVRREVLRVTRSTGEENEFVLHPASTLAWRSHLGRWAAEQRRTDADRVTPGRPGDRPSRRPRERRPTGQDSLRPH